MSGEARRQEEARLRKMGCTTTQAFAAAAEAEIARLTAALKDAAEQQQERELEIRREYIEELREKDAALKDAEHYRDCIGLSYSAAIETMDRLQQKLKDAERERERLRKAIERDAAELAYRSGLGVSEWDAFVPKWTWEALQESAPQGAEAGE